MHDLSLSGSRIQVTNTSLILLNYLFFAFKSVCFFPSDLRHKCFPVLHKHPSVYLCIYVNVYLFSAYLSMYFLQKHRLSL